MSAHRRGASALGLLATLILIAAVGLAAYGMYTPGTDSGTSAGSSTGQGPIGAARQVALTSAGQAIVSTANANGAFNDGGNVTDETLNAAAEEVTAGTELTWTPASMGTGYLSDGTATVTVTIVDGTATLS